MLRYSPIVLVVLLTPSLVSAQEYCVEPADAAYGERMAATRAAIEAGDFELALEHLSWAREHFDFAVIEFATARAYHRLERFEEAEQMYTQFMRHFEGCSNESGLRETAQQYHALALQQYLTALAEASPPSQGPDPATVAQAEDFGGATALQVTTQASRTASTLTDSVEPVDEGIHPAWWIVSAGGALVLGGLVYDLANASVLDERDAAAAAGDHTRVAELNDEVKTIRLVDGLVIGTGLVVAIGGVVYYFLDTGDEAPTESIGITPEVGGAQVWWGHQF